MAEWLAAQNALFVVFVALLCAAVVVISYGVFMAIYSWFETRNIPKTEFFTCDRHGAFPVKLLMMIDLGDGRPPIKQCPFCYSDSFKTADARLKAEEAKRTAKPALTGKK
jgi:hypothetical protein